MLAVKPVVDDALRLLERMLHQEFNVDLSRNAGGEGEARIAEIINRLDRERDRRDPPGPSLDAAARRRDAQEPTVLVRRLTKLSQRARTALFDKVRPTRW